MAKGDILRKLLRMKHSPAGKKYLKGKKKDTESVYFKGIKRKSIEARLSEAGVSEADIRRLRGGKKK